jgi:hypothetical protein
MPASIVVHPVVGNHFRTGGFASLQSGDPLANMRGHLPSRTRSNPGAGTLIGS